jgi:hypothetical protein
VNEFGTELNRQAAVVAHGEDSSADAVASFDDGYADARHVELACGSQPGGASANHHHVVCGASIHVRRSRMPGAIGQVTHVEPAFRPRR